MNAIDILSYGDRDLRHAFEGLEGEAWNMVGVTTRWSLKDMLAHLASFEVVLAEVLGSFQGSSDTSTLDDMRRDQSGFNDRQVEKRKTASLEDLWAEYDRAHSDLMEAARGLGPERLREVGTIPWYGPEYSLDDFIVYTNYAHKREHVADIKQFRRRQGMPVTS